MSENNAPEKADAPAEATGIEAPEAAPEGLGDAGKKALQQERDARKAAERKVAEAETKAAEALAKLEGREAEFKAEQERQAAVTDALSKRDGQIVLARLEAAATGKLADPSDVGLYVDAKDFEVSETGAVDTASMAAAIADLIDRKPHLAARGGDTPSTPLPDRSQGAMGATTGSSTAQQFAAAINRK